jgi:Ca-activated chloride channel family protein
MFNTLIVAWPWVFLCLPLPWFIQRLPALPYREWTPPLYNFLGLQEKRSNYWPWLFAWLIWLLLLTAAARPQWLSPPQAIEMPGRHIFLVIDLSASMAESDMFLGAQRLDRLTAVKIVASDFIKRREGDRLGLILFADQAFVQAPLTFDRETVNTLLQESVLGLAGNATALGDAIALGVKRFVAVEAKEKLLIVLSDGESNTGLLTPSRAADLAAAAGVKVYTIGFGRLNIKEVNDLKEVANKSGGMFFEARNLEQLQRIYQDIDTLEPTLQPQGFYQARQELYVYPLTLALLLTLFLGLWWRWQ